MYKSLSPVAASILWALSINAFAAEIYDSQKSYPGGSQVVFNGKVYEAQWWANPGDSPAKVTNNAWESPWIFVENSSGALPPSPDSGGGSTAPPVQPAPPALEGDYDQYKEGTKYKGGDLVEVDGQLYRCKEGVTVAWCSGAAWAYAPGKGTAWPDAWEKVTEENATNPPTTPAPAPDPEPDIKPEPELKPDPEPEVEQKPEPDNSVGGNVGADGSYEILRSELTKKEKALTNFPLMDLVKETIRTRSNEVVDNILPLSATNPENVKRVESFISADSWNNELFPKRAVEYTYRNFLQAVGKFPALCGTYTDGRDSDAICRKTLATMFAHFAQETGGHAASWDVPEWRQGLVYVREMGWTEQGRGGYNGECGQKELWQQKKWPCGTFPNGEFKSYFGRGAKQLSYNFNYGPFSEAIYGDVSVLLNQPELVADTWLNLASAIFFFLYPQPPKPSMLHVIDGTWKPNQRDLDNGLFPGFGVTTQIINGGVECGGSVEVAQSLNRISYYKSFANHFGIDVPENEILGCKGMKSFDADGAGAINIYWIEDWGWRPDTPGEKSYACQLVGYQTAFSAFVEGDYAKCVQDYFPNTVIIEDQ